VGPEYAGIFKDIRSLIHLEDIVNIAGDRVKTKGTGQKAKVGYFAYRRYCH